MQGGFIGNIKKTLKNIKQEIKGADIHNVDFIPRVLEIREKNNLKLQSLINYQELGLNIEVYNKIFHQNYNVYKLSVVKTLININKKELFDKVQIKELNLFKENDKYIEVNKIENYNVFETKILWKDLEEFKTRVLYELIEEIEKAKINGGKEKPFKAKVIKGEGKILKIPKKFQGRSFLVKKDMLDVAVKVKTVKPNFDFTKYRFLIIFDNLPISHMNKFKYNSETKELLFYFDNKTKEVPSKMSLVIWSKKGEETLEKIFI